MTFFFGKIEPGYHDIQKHSTVLLHVDTSVSSCEALGNMRGYVGCLEQHGMVGIPWNQTPEVQDQSLGGWMFYPKKSEFTAEKVTKGPNRMASEKSKPKSVVHFGGEGTRPQTLWRRKIGRDVLNWLASWVNLSPLLKLKLLVTCIVSFKII